MNKNQYENPSLCIPRVNEKITEKEIRRVIEEINIGKIARIDIMKINKSVKGIQYKFKSVFIHFYNWNKNDNAEQAKNRLLNGKDIKVIYQDPWFWKITAYKYK